MSKCSCCGTCCNCNRLVKTLRVKTPNANYELSINKRISDMNCFYYAYIGDCSKYYLPNDSGTNTAYQINSLIITISFGKGNSVQNFAFQCSDNDVPTFATTKVFQYVENEENKLKITSENETLPNTIYLNYNKKLLSFKISRNLRSSVDPEYIRQAIISFATTNNFLELLNCSVSVVTIPIEAGTPLNFEQYVESYDKFNWEPCGHTDTTEVRNAFTGCNNLASNILLDNYRNIFASDFPGYSYQHTASFKKVITGLLITANFKDFTMNIAPYYYMEYRQQITTKAKKTGNYYIERSHCKPCFVNTTGCNSSC